MADSQFDINKILEVGSFQTSRGKSPQPDAQSPVERQSRYSSRPSERIELSGYSSTSTSTSTTTSSYDTKPLGRSLNRSRQPSNVRRPPPPSVEDDDAEAEFPNEQVKSRGDIDQNPVIIDMVDYIENTERKWVFYQPGMGDDDASPDYENDSPVNGDEYVANTSRKYKTGQPSSPSTLNTPPIPIGMRRKKSNKDLPPLSTEVGSSSSRNNSNMGRNRSRSRPQQDPDYFSPRHSTRKSRDGLLSPDVIKQGTRDREEVSIDYSSRQNGPALGRAHSTGKRFGHGKSASHSSSPTMGRHPRIDRERHQRQFSRERERSVSKERSKSTERTRPPGHERRTSESPAPRRREKKSSPSPPGGSRQDREKMPRRVSTQKKRESPSRKKTSGYSSGEDGTPRRTASSYRHRPSVTQEEKTSGHLGPGGPRAPGAHSRARSKSNVSGSPMPPPNYGDAFAQGPRSAATMPIQHPDAPPAPYPDDDLLQPSLTGRRSVRDPRSRSREPTTMPAMPAMPMPIPTPAGPRDMVDRRRSAAPGYEYANDAAYIGPSPSHPTAQSWQPSPPKDSWQPGPFVPATMYMKPDKAVGSYRRYSEDVDRGGLPPLPDCPRREGVAGMSDWLTLPRCENFNICPNCFTRVFANTPYRAQFLPMPWRPREKKIACDFGSTPWYRIAYLLTLKNRIPDLRLFGEIDSVESDVAARNQACSGNRRTARLWHSIRNPATGRFIPDFTVCYECSKTVEVLLPNLRGVLARLDGPAEATRGTCAMHFTIERRRFTLLFDALETASDSALAVGSSPDIAALAEDIDALVSVPECREDTPLPNSRWYVMEQLPELTVCEACFHEVVEPRQASGEAGKDMARSFYLRKLAGANTCQLYSQRMRDVFTNACREGKLGMLEESVLERRKVENRVRNQLAKMDQEEGRSKEQDEAIEQLVQYWKRWE